MLSDSEVRCRALPSGDQIGQKSFANTYRKPARAFPMYTYEKTICIEHAHIRSASSVHSLSLATPVSACDVLLSRRRRLERPEDEVLQPGAPGHAACCLNLHAIARRPSPPLHALRVLCAHACCRLLHAASRRPYDRPGFQITMPAAVGRAAAPFAACSDRLRRFQLASRLARQPSAAASFISGPGVMG